MQAVLGLVKDFIGVRLENGLRNLLAAVRRQAVLHHNIPGAYGKKLVVDLIASEGRAALLRLALHAHRRPDVRKNNIGAGRRRMDVVGQAEFIAISRREREHRSIRLVRLRRSDRHVHAYL